METDSHKYAKTNIGLKSIKICGANLYHSLPPYIKDIKNLKSFNTGEGNLLRVLIGCNYSNMREKMLTFNDPCIFFVFLFFCLFIAFLCHPAWYTIVLFG